MVFLIYTLAAIPAISIIWTLVDWRDIVLMRKAKIALEYLNAFFIAGAGISVIYALTTDFSYLSPAINFDNIAKAGFNQRDGFTFLFSIISFPFLTSTAFCKAIIEHRLSKAEHS